MIVLYTDTIILITSLVFYHLILKDLIGMYSISNKITINTGHLFSPIINTVISPDS